MIDTDVIKRCQQGDEEAFYQLYKISAKKAIWTAYLIAGRMDIAEDIVQEAFFECFLNIKKLQKPELFNVWFNRIVVRTCWRIINREKKNTADRLELKDELEDSSTSEMFETMHMNRVIREQVKKLNSKMRTVVILYYFNSMTVKEISEVMNCLQGTVKSRLHYAKKELAKVLGREFYEQFSCEPGFAGKECATNE